MDADAIVVARRWDGLGARLYAIFNAWSVARALGVGFGFAWSRRHRLELQEPRELFSDAFLGRFEIAETGRAVQPYRTGLTLTDARDFCRAAAATSLVEIDECFRVLAFADESAEAAGARFRAGLREIGWSRTAQALIDYAADETRARGYAVLHIRAGDIVTGDWRQFVPVDKYTPTPYVEFAIETLSGADRRPVVVTSDNDAYVRYLKNRFDVIRTPEDMVAGYAELTEAQRAFADILVLSQARQLVGPQTSAFSQFAASLGGLTLTSFTELTSESDAQDRLRDGIARAKAEAERTRVLRPLLARDICWFLDVFSDGVTLDEQIDLTRQAVELDPDFCGALNRSAAALAVAGHRRASREASSRARGMTANVKCHEDPLVETLATSIAADALALAVGPRGGGLLKRIGLAAIAGRFGGIDSARILDDMILSLARYETLAPFQINHAEVLRNLRFQIAAATWLAAADAAARDIARASIQPSGDAPPFLAAWRPSGFKSLRAGIMSQVLRNIEVTTIRIACAVGAGVCRVPRPSRPSAVIAVDSVTVSPSGVRWVSGWAYDAELGQAELAVGCISVDGIASGGVTVLPRPDVAAALNDPRAATCGFAFPVPVAAQEITGDLRAKMRIATPRRLRRPAI